MTIMFPVALAAFILVFLYYKQSSVFLRKRSIELVILCVFGSIVLWSCTALYDVIGSQLYPCWLHAALVYLSIPLIAGPIMLKAALYINEVSAARLLKGELLLVEAEDGGFVDITDCHQTVPTMWESFKCYARVFMGNRERAVRVKAARFTSSKTFTYAWMLFSTIPYLIAYMVRLSTSAQWQNGCYGCEIELPDAAFLLAFYLFGTILFGIQVPIRIVATTRDALRIKRECAIAWVGAGVWISLAMLLFLVDPNGAYASSAFNFRILALFGALHATYVQTVHQVIVARRLQRKLLASPNFNRDDLFTDVMQDKDLSTKLKNFLHAELSSEIMLFLSAVDQFRKEFEIRKDSRQRMARQIYDEFVVRRAPNEINLSSEVRDRTSNRVEHGNVNVHVFDDAYAEIKSMLLKDGFTRFLGTIRGDLSKVSHSSAAASVVVANAVHV